MHVCWKNKPHQVNFAISSHHLFVLSIKQDLPYPQAVSIAGVDVTVHAKTHHYSITSVRIQEPHQLSKKSIYTYDENRQIPSGRSYLRRAGPKAQTGSRKQLQSLFNHRRNMSRPSEITFPSYHRRSHRRRAYRRRWRPAELIPFTPARMQILTASARASHGDGSEAR